MFKQTLLFATLGAAIAAVYGTAAAQPAPKQRTAGLSSSCAANAPVREFLVATGEWDTVPSDRDKKPAAYNDRGQARAAGSKLERYTFDPGFIMVKKGDCVTLRIHAVKGSHHNVTIEGTEIGSEKAQVIDDRGAVVATAAKRPSPNKFEDPATLKDGEFVRGEEVRIKFQANQPGTYRMVCEVHTFIGPKGELRAYDDKGKSLQGPMVGYIYVLP
jgi:plastocyanin